MPNAINLDLLIDNVNLATMDPSAEGAYGAIEAAWLAVADGRIHSLGTGPAPQAKVVVDGRGGWLTPGLIDCHTHLIWGGNRAREFEARLEGKSYRQIAEAGGGINSTVAATRRASDAELLTDARARLQSLAAEGVSTLEIKSGYGLNLEQELRLLKLAATLEQESGLTISKTLLAAHALPPEFAGRSDDYIDLVCEQIIPQAAAAGLADCVDVFCEGVGFNLAQCRRVFSAAQANGLPVKGHVEQLSDLKGARLVAEFKGWSADHIEYLQAEDVAALAGTVAVLLPGAFYALQETQRPPIDALRQHSISMAVASDLNPGTSPFASLRLAMNQACVLFGLTPAEALAGVTRAAAQALGLNQSKGQLSAGFDADLVLWSIDHPSELSYGLNLVRPESMWIGGRPF
ncbi:MAG: imidazolonepropionase [Cellvibrionaceae bacterium]|nr:imidazolonepropionase [Cellvibrionaceae bacterium]